MRPVFLLFLLPTLAWAQHAGHGAAPTPRPPPPTEAQAAHPGQMPPGYAEVQVTPERQQLIGLKVVRATRETLGGTVRATALVEPDEASEAHVHTKLMGWVQTLYVNKVGERVKKGDPLYALYSQELYAAEQEFLRARKSLPELARSARQRLELWDVPEDQIRLIERRGPQKTIIFRSPIAGTVIEKAVLAGHYVEPGGMLYRIADLSHVWIIASTYEFEVNRLQVGGLAQVSVEGVPEPVEARVDYVYPTVDPATRTVKVRLVAQNPEGTLRPGGYAIAQLPTRPAEALWVPAEAVIDNGVHQVVFVSLGEGRFRPAVVQVGRRTTDRTEILSGLEPGQQVVVSAQFLIDSESRIRGTSEQGGHAGHGSH